MKDISQLRGSSAGFLFIAQESVMQFFFFIIILEQLRPKDSILHFFFCLQYKRVRTGYTIVRIVTGYIGLCRSNYLESTTPY